MNNKRLSVQLWLGVILAIVGVILLFISLFLPQVGVIDPSVLAATGEILTFSGSILGVDWNYKYKIEELKLKQEKSHLSD